MSSEGNNHGPCFNSLKQGKTIKLRYIKPESVKILERLALEKLKERYPNNPYYPKPTYTDSTSNKLIKCVVDYIGFNGFQVEKINSKGFFIDKRKTSTDVLGNKRTIGSVQFIKTNHKNKFYNISTTIKGQNIKILIKSSPIVSKNQDKGSVGSIKQIESAEGLFLIVENFSQFFQWLNEFTKD
ncbi:hypothetical protein SAMN05443549_101741 [Flavobacterium fluvii]|uniref:Uncharacterized protein n=1 Tax=Flavobacterium fluvii TaxID=468056 RepID=A0A1M5FDP4_9FLAO|nr:hypothetical protein [Flavobacterium fluvii]SHF89626.1 hypothetical protein SAMN05443549_101741 [Flavobacterium fluvii]